MGDTVRIACAVENCGTFPLDRELRDKLKRTGEPFTCPSGHEMSFTKTALDEAREEISRLRSALEQREAALERLSKKADTLRDHLREKNDELWAEQQANSHLERLVFSELSGIIEVEPGRYSWSCACGSRAQKSYPSEEAAREHFKEHQRRVGCEAEEPPLLEA